MILSRIGKFIGFKDDKFDWEVFLQRMVLLLVLAIVLLGLIRFSSFLGIVYCYKFLVGYIARTTAWNIWLVRALSLPIAFVLMYCLRLVFSLKKSDRQFGYMVISVIMTFFFISMFFVTKNFVFASDGTPQKCYASTLSGYEYVSCNWKVHPYYGTPVRPVVSSIVNAMENTKNGVQRIQRIAPNSDLRFFTPAGDPLIWYYQRPDGKIELFDQPGNHPQYQGVILSPVTSEIAQKLISDIESNEGQAIVIVGDKKREGSELGKLKSLLLSTQGGK